jgi:hypothetical protein
MLLTPIQVLPAHKAGEAVVPYPDSLTALWDTGAQSSTISSVLAVKLGLPAIGQRVMNGAGGSYIAKEYLAGLLLPNRILINSISLYDFVGAPHFDMLIGMDIITMGDFLVSSHSGITHFSFQIPSIGGVTLQNIRQAITQDGKIVTTGGGTVIRPTAKIGRNDPCFCGSGKKYKNCHG